MKNNLLNIGKRKIIQLLLALFAIKVLEWLIYFTTNDAYNEFVLVLKLNIILIILIWVVFVIIAFTNTFGKPYIYSLPLLYASAATLILKLILAMYVVVETYLDAEWFIRHELFLGSYIAMFIVTIIYSYIVLID